MRERTIVVKMTKEEATELLLVADNGYGDGTYYDTRRGCREEKLYERATKKIMTALWNCVRPVSKS